MADRVSDIFALPRDQFDGLLNELEGAGRDTSDLLRQYRRENSIFSGLYDWADSTQDDLASEGRRGVGGGLLSKDIGSTGGDAVGSMRLEPGAFVSGLLGSAGQALDAPAAAARGDMLPQDMIGEALNTAGIAQLGGASMTAPVGALRSGLARGGAISKRTSGNYEVFSYADQNGVNLGEMYVRTMPDGRREVADVSVNEGARRQGVGSALYDEAGISGPSDNISKDAFDFWQSRNPAALSDSLYNDFDKLMGMELTNASGFSGVVSDVRNDFVSVKNNGISLPIYRDELADMGLLSANRDALTGTAAQEVSGLLRNNRAADVTDDMMAAVDPQEMFRLYESGATGVDMPMDAASRAARAEGMGFDTGAPLYHGTGADFPAFERGLNRVDGTSDQVYGDGIYLSEFPSQASSYAPRVGRNGGGGSVLPLASRSQNPYEGIDSFDTLADRRRYLTSEGTQDLADYGFDSNRNWMGISIELDPSNIRSQFARFDPRLGHLSNLNAANASPMTGLLAAPVAQETQELPFQKFLRGLFQ
jgi:hypothetical protein